MIKNPSNVPNFNNKKPLIPIQYDDIPDEDLLPTPEQRKILSAMWDWKEKCAKELEDFEIGGLLSSFT